MCLYWRSHGFSPGEWHDPQDTLAVELHVQARSVGWETVWALRHLELTREDAEALVWRLQWIEQYVKTLPPAPGVTITESE